MKSAILPSTSQPATTWRLRPYKTFAYRFFPLFLLLFGISFATSYGWMVYMDDCCKASAPRKTYIFIMLIIVAGVLYWTLNEISDKYNRFRSVMRVVSQYQSIVQQWFRQCNNPAAVNSAIALRISGNLYQIDFPTAMKDAVLATTASLFLFLWQITHSQHILNHELETTAASIAQRTLNVDAQQAAHNAIDIEFAHHISSDFRDPFVACIMNRIIITRIERMMKCQSRTSAADAPAMLKGQERLITAFETLEKEINNLKPMPDVNSLLWIKLPMAFVGMLFPFLVSPLLYSNVLDDILYVGPVVFIFVGGPVLFNIMLSDPLRSPTDMHMAYIYDQLMDISAEAQSLYNTFISIYDRFVSQKQEEQTETAATDPRIRELMELRQKIRTYENIQQYKKETQTSVFKDAARQWLETAPHSNATKLI